MEKDEIQITESVKIAHRVSEVLLAKGLVMGTAESCTGGAIAGLITSMAGSSTYFSGGVVAYCNEVKISVLGVSAEAIVVHGAVSRTVVEQMALGAVRVLGCDCVVATSGIAGPTGGSPDKPVGTVWIAVALKDKVVSSVYHWKGDRTQNIRLSVDAALTLLITVAERFVNE